MEKAAAAAGQYLPVQVLEPPAPRNPAVRDSSFWKTFKTVSTPQHIAGISHIDFCPVAPYDFAVTSSTRVVVYNGETAKEKKNFGRFTDVAYSGSFRSDGQLLVAGGELGMVQVFDVNSRTILRQLKGHSRAVHWVRYSPLEKLHVLSASDDCTVRWWDVAAQEEASKFEEHTDYVRCGAASPISTDLWATGSYDHTVRLWDLRSARSSLQIQHGKPLEDVLFFPSGGLLATAGGNEVKIWDIIGGGRLLHVLGSHQKTVTSLIITPPLKCGSASAPASPRLLTSSLDGHVKVFDLDNFKVAHSVLYPHPILSLNISPAGTTLAAGMSSGTLHVRQRKQSKEVVPSDEGLLSGPMRPRRQRALNPSNYRYFIRGYSEKASDEDYYVAKEKRPHLAEHDRFLRQFQYKEALNAALQSAEPRVVVAVMEELVARSGLISALSNRDSLSLALLLSFLVKYVTVPRYSKLLVPVAQRVIDIYGNVFGQSSSIRHLIEVLKENVKVEVRLQESLLELQGVLQPLIQASVQA